MDDWTQLESSDECARNVVAIGRRLYQNDSGRRNRMISNIRRYEYGSISCSESPHAVNTGDTAASLMTEDGSPVRWNLCHSLAATATAKIAGTQQPKVTCLATNASWRIRRKGPKMGQFLHGLWSTRQGQYVDIWELGNANFRDCASCGIGLTKVSADFDGGKVVHERAFPWEVLVDREDARYGNPQQLWHVYTSSKGALKAGWPELADKIDAARASGDPDDQALNIFDRSSSQSERVVEAVRVYEWWMLPYSKDKPGRHIIAIDGACLVDEDWKRSRFPFAILRWDPRFAGWDSGSLIDEAAAIDDETNDLLSRISRAVRLTSMSTCYVEEGSDVDGEVITNEDAQVIRFTGTKPLYETPEPISPTHVTLLQMHKAAAYEMTGVNQMSATAQKQPGIESGEAIRLVSDLQSERFGPMVKAYQNWYVDVARLDIDCVRELAEDKPDFAVSWPGSGFLRSIAWKDVSLEEDMYVLQLVPMPGIHDTAADRMQTGEALYAAGNISADALMAIRQVYDTPGEIASARKQSEIVDRYIEDWLDATDEEIASGKKADGSDLFRPPIRWMRLDAALAQVANAYMQAELDDVPDNIRSLMLHWIELASDEIDKRMARMKALAPPPAPPPGAPAPMQPQPMA